MTALPKMPLDLLDPGRTDGRAFHVKKKGSSQIWTATRKTTHIWENTWYLVTTGHDGISSIVSKAEDLEMVAPLGFTLVHEPANLIDPADTELHVVEYDGRRWFGTRGRVLRPDRAVGSEWFLFAPSRIIFAPDEQVEPIARLTPESGGAR